MAGLTVVGAGTMGESDLVNFTGFDLFGDMLALTAALVWAVYSTLGRSYCPERLRNDRGHEARIRLGRCLHLGYHAHLRPACTAAICSSRRAEPAQSALSGCSGISGVLRHMGRCREASGGNRDDHLHLSRSRHHGDCFHSYSRRTAERAYNPWLSYDDRWTFTVAKTKREQKDASCKTDRSVLG